MEREGLFVLEHNSELCSVRSRIGGVVVSILATGPKGRGSNLAEAMEF